MFEIVVGFLRLVYVCIYTLVGSCKSTVEGSCIYTIVVVQLVLYEAQWFGSIVFCREILSNRYKCDCFCLYGLFNNNHFLGIKIKNKNSTCWWIFFKINIFYFLFLFFYDVGAIKKNVLFHPLKICALLPRQHMLS